MRTPYKLTLALLFLLMLWMPSLLHARTPTGVTDTIMAVVNCTCAGSCNGSATATPSGGTPPYTFSWSPSGGTGATASALCAGTYTVFVTDNAGLFVNSHVTITQPATLTATASATTTSCGSPTGTATGTASGGTTPYTWSWSPAPGGGQGTMNATGLSAGTYTLTLTDKNLCTITTTATVATPSPPTATLASSINVYCFGACTGSATVTTSGGTSPYTYSWTPSGITSAHATLLCAGTYTCNVGDAHGCHSSVVVVISQNAALAATGTSVSATCSTCHDGSATVTPSNGNPPYTYSWSPGGQTTATDTGLAPGTYTCCITDGAACQICHYQNVPYSMGIADNMEDLSFNPYPNPFGDKLMLETGAQLLEGELVLYNLIGEEVLRRKITPGTSELDTQSLAPGTYFLALNSGKGRMVRKVIRREQ